MILSRWKSQILYWLTVSWVILLLDLGLRILCEWTYLLNKKNFYTDFGFINVSSDILALGLGCRKPSLLCQKFHWVTWLRNYKDISTLHTHEQPLDHSGYILLIHFSGDTWELLRLPLLCSDHPLFSLLLQKILWHFGKDFLRPREKIYVYGSFKMSLVLI